MNNYSTTKTHTKRKKSTVQINSSCKCIVSCWIYNSERVFWYGWKRPWDIPPSFSLPLLHRIRHHQGRAAPWLSIEDGEADNHTKSHISFLPGDSKETYQPWIWQICLNTVTGTHPSTFCVAISLGVWCIATSKSWDRGIIHTDTLWW